MTLEEQYTQLLQEEKKKETLAFLQTLSDEQKRLLAPCVIKLNKEFSKFELVGNTYKTKGTEKQNHILAYTGFVCFNRKEFEKENPSWIIAREHLDKLISWYCPAWFSDYINGFSEREWMPFQLDYNYLMELTEKGFLQPQSQIIARLLPLIIFEHTNEVVNKRHVHTTHFKPENVLRHSITLKEHIWYLFEYESGVSHTNQWVHFEGREQHLDLGWIYVFKKYSSDGKIDRQRLLQESLLASNRNFNKNLSGWFADLFMQLQPDTKEMLSLQPELFGLFSAPHSKVVNTALQSCKAIVNEAGFDAAGFLDYVPLLIASDTKSVVITTLQLLEKLAQKYSNQQPRICLLATGAFIHKEEALQTKAAKLIVKYTTVDDEEIRETLMQYSDSLFSTVKLLLNSFITATTVQASEMYQPEKAKAVFEPGVLTVETALPEIHNIDELVFLASQAFDNNQSYHIDLVLAALLRLQKLVTADQISKLEPAFQRALKFYFGDWRSGQGYLDHLLAGLFLDFGTQLMRQYPEATIPLRQLYGKYLATEDGTDRLWRMHGPDDSYVKGWSANNNELVYEPYKKIAELVSKTWKGEQNIPLLSTPTHAPAWIDPIILAERMYEYQQHHLSPDVTDLQIALSRCWLHQTEAAVAFIKEKITGEEKELLLFLLQPDALPKEPFTKEWMWMIAGLSKAPAVVYPEFEAFSYQQKTRALFTGQRPWKTHLENYFEQKPSWKDEKFYYEKVPATRKVLRVDFTTEEHTEKAAFKTVLSEISPAIKHRNLPAEPLLYEYFQTKSSYISISENDIRRLIMLAPNNPEPLIALIIHKCLEYPGFWGESEKRCTIAVLQSLHDIWKSFGEITHLFIATCMISSDKTAAAYAAEIWIRGVTENNIDSQLIGTILGKHESVEFAPLKRFTDLVIHQLLSVSPAHTKALEQLLVAMLKELPAEPIKNLKKLLEIYFEVIALNNSAVENTDIKNLLHQWKQNAGLSKVIKAIV